MYSASIFNSCTILLIFLNLLNPLLTWGQEEDTEEEDISKRIFMPSIQMGYVRNFSDELSGGIFIQTSLEYQTRKGIFFRLNYDDFDSDYAISERIGSVGFLKGRVSFAELIGGVGYRRVLQKHDVLAAAQFGYRFYAFPVVQEQGQDILLELDNRDALVSRYTLGYEYEIEKKVFLALELFASNAWEQKDYWEENSWLIGFTVGITTTIY